ncbi:accessory Sec system protein Asp3 [Lactococcus garvieae]|jgi:accessory Sec system protein Asp3|uniref:accessory Sec system protein Asp3 n=1 Tax=Lactococcus garvieae TaxID=1363 RepID=UPI0018D71F54|nr:accessory Sec system protein Asp3 [Lactococcus garvieae]QPS71757.1 accessory Sec system protein Asp3 [Lactococcus garvieae]
MRFEIDWTSALIDIYKYGSTVTMRDSEIFFKNTNLPPGAVIATWGSNITYQQVRTPLQLPLLKKGESYCLSFNGQILPEHSIMLQIIFLDRGGKVIEKQVLPSKGGDFTYIKNAYAYSIAIISVGLNEMTFSKLSISSIERGR